MKKTSFREFDPARYVDSDETALAFLHMTCQDGTASEIAEALGIIARARGITKVAKQVGMSRQALYKALSADGNPEFSTITKVAGALGLRLAIERRETSIEKESAVSTKDAA